MDIDVISGDVRKAVDPDFYITTWTFMDTIREALIDIEG